MLSHSNSAARRQERELEQKPGRKAECEADNGDTDSDGSDCLVANESIRVSNNSPGLRRIRKQVSFLNSYKRRIVDHGHCSQHESPECANKEHLNYSPQAALLSNNSPVQEEIAVSQMSRPHRSSNIRPESSFEKENVVCPTEMLIARKIMTNAAKAPSVLRLVSQNTQPAVYTG